MDYLNDTTYVDQAEEVIKTIKELKDNRGKTIPMVTTSKIRNILSMAADIYNHVMRELSLQLKPETVSRVEYLRVRVLYEAGRDGAVKDFVNYAKLTEYLKMVGNDKSKYILFYHYLEALIAFHKYYGGKEQ